MVASMYTENEPVPFEGFPDLGFSNREKTARKILALEDIAQEPSFTGNVIDLSYILAQICDEARNTFNACCVSLYLYDCEIPYKSKEELVELDRVVRQTLELANHNSTIWQAKSELLDHVEQYAELAKYYEDLLSSKEIQDESWEKISQELQRLNFYRGLFSKLLVKILCLISRTCKILIACGKGIEGFIAYLTWARPPSKPQLVTIVSTLIDKLSRPGNAYTEMCYAS